MIRGCLRQLHSSPSLLRGAQRAVCGLQQLGWVLHIRLMHRETDRYASETEIAHSVFNPFSGY